MTHFRDFLQDEPATVCLPYFGGATVCDARRTYRLVQRPAGPGWYHFRLRGRRLQVVEAADPETERLPIARGYLADGRFVFEKDVARIYGLDSDREAERFVPVEAARWHDGNYLFLNFAFEEEADIAVREAYEDGASLDAIAGVTPVLAHAFFLETTAIELRRIERQMRLEEERLEAEAEKRAHVHATLYAEEATLDGRIALALSHAGAELLGWRSVTRGQLHVRYRMGGQRLECIINRDTLRIEDAGICLSGADAELNLSSLPAAVQEAIDHGLLYVMR